MRSARSPNRVRASSRRRGRRVRRTTGARGRSRTGPSIRTGRRPPRHRSPCPGAQTDGARDRSRGDPAARPVAPAPTALDVARGLRESCDRGRRIDRGAAVRTCPSHSAARRDDPLAGGPRIALRRTRRRGQRADACAPRSRSVGRTDRCRSRQEPKSPRHRRPPSAPVRGRGTRWPSAAPPPEHRGPGRAVPPCRSVPPQNRAARRAPPTRQGGARRATQIRLAARGGRTLDVAAAG